MNNRHENNGADRQQIEELSVLATTRGLDQLTAEEEQVLAAGLAKPANKELQGASEQASRIAAAVAAAITEKELPAPSTNLRQTLEAELGGAIVSPAKNSESKASARNALLRTYGVGAMLLVVAGLLVALWLPQVQMARESRKSAIKTSDFENRVSEYRKEIDEAKERLEFEQAARRYGLSETRAAAEATIAVAESEVTASRSILKQTGQRVSDEQLQRAKPAHDEYSGVAPRIIVTEESSEHSPLGIPGQPPATPANPTSHTIKVREAVPLPHYFSEQAGQRGSGLGTALENKEGGYVQDGRLLVEGGRSMGRSGMSAAGQVPPGMVAGGATPGGMPGDVSEGWRYRYDRRDHFGQTFESQRGATGEAYAPIHENAFKLVRDEPLSTFSSDVDSASYANVRRFLSTGQLPPRDAVRIEELLNYFPYDYPQPQEKDPFSVNMEVTECPWRPENRLLRVGLKGREVPKQERAASNLVFLIDVSGSMQPENKLPLIKTSLKMLVQELTENDRVSIVTYAGEAGLRLPSTNGTEQSRIADTIESLSAGGSTHGSAGIELAYQQATEYFIKGGTNRVILLTDGDLNVGITDDDALVQLIQRKAKSGVFLTVLGVGEGNLKDSKMEKLADHGNGIYAYLDSVREAHKVFVEQMAGSLITIAKDVKFQIEFNPAQVQAYRLIGYENRVLANRDFHDDTKDAGEIGAGHTVTALYELVPASGAVPGAAEPLKYQPQRVTRDDSGEPVGVSPRAGAPAEQFSRELLTLTLRFKKPESDRSELRDYPLAERGGKFGQASTDFRFAASVAMFGLVLRDSQYRGNATLAAVEEIATSSLGSDTRGYRSEFVDLVRKAEQLK